NEDFNKIDETIKIISKNLRKGDWSYLYQHLEVRAIIRVIVTEAIKQRPENIFKFTADLFNCRNSKSLIAKINKQLKWLKKQMNDGVWSPAEGAVSFSQSSTSSFTTKKQDCDDFKKDSDDVDSDCDLMPNKNACPETFKPSC
ncbi:CG34021, partial [Drosophila busckii]